MSTVSTYKLSEELCAEDFILIALHSSLEDHALAYALNNELKIKLSRSREDFELSENNSFPVFEWKDEINDRDWILIPNLNVKEENLNRQDLFENVMSQTVHHLIPEHKEVDFFLKIEQGDESLDEELMKHILTIPNIVTAYLVDTEQLKSKYNLIF